MSIIGLQGCNFFFFLVLLFWGVDVILVIVGRLGCMMRKVRNIMVILILICGFFLGYFTSSIVYRIVVEAYDDQAYFLTVGYDRKTIVNVAQFYYDRGSYIQFDDSYMDDGASVLRRNSLVYPEVATRDNYVYMDDDSFLLNVYKAALNYDFSHIYGNNSLAWINFGKNVYNVAVKNGYEGDFYNKSDSSDYVSEVSNASEIIIYQELADDGDKDLVMDIFSSNLVSGDIVVVRDKEGETYSFLYIGGEKFLAAIGESYNYEESLDNWEDEGAIQYIDLDGFISDNGKYSLISDSISDYMIMRLVLNPITLADYAEAVGTYNSNYSLMGDIIEVPKLKVELVSSVSSGQLVSIDEEITYTFYLTNNSDSSLSLPVLYASIPEGTVYVRNSLGDSAYSEDDNGLAWSDMVISANSTLEISYTVKVNREEGEIIQKGAYFKQSNGLVFPSIVHRVGKKIADDVYEEMVELSQGDDFNLNSLYRQVMGIEIGSVDSLFDNLEKGELSSIMVSLLYGGRKLSGFSDRLRYVSVKFLRTGDIVSYMDDGVVTAMLYLDEGDNSYLVWNTDSGVMRSDEVNGILDSLLSKDYYMVLRPSLDEGYRRLSFGDLEVDYEKLIIWKLEVGMTTEELLNFIDTSGVVTFYDESLEVKSDDIIRTGDKIEFLFDTEKVIYDLSVLGDVTGTGGINVSDVAKGYRYLRKKIELDDCYIYALDVTLDKEIKVNDIAKLYRYVRKKIEGLE